VWIPGTYAGTDCEPLSICNPGTTLIIDLRGGMFQTWPPLAASAIPNPLVVQGLTVNGSAIVNGQAVFGPCGGTVPCISGFTFNAADPFGLCNAAGKDQLTDVIDPTDGEGSLAFNNCDNPGDLQQRV
jgi:hypothetical protein